MEVKALSQGGQNFYNSNNNLQENSNSNMVTDSAIVNSKNSQVDVSLKDNSTHQNKIDEKDIKKSVDKLNELLEGKSTHVEYEPVGKSKHMSIKIVDSQTKEVIKEIPPKKIIEMMDKLCEMAGIMLDGKA